MHKIAFLNPEGIKAERFSTVRLGSKWAERTKPESLDKLVSVELVDGDGNSLGIAVAMSCWYGPIAEVPAMMLECEHDPICRTWSGLRLILQMCYPKEEITPHTTVSVLELHYTGSVIKIPEKRLILPE